MEMKPMLAYRIDIAPDDNDTVLVTCPLLPEVTTFGETGEEVLPRAIAAIEEALAGRIARGEDIPVEDPDEARRSGATYHRMPIQTSLKVMLYLACRSLGVTRAELSRRLGWHREQVDRLFRLDHATRLDQFDAAFNALGQAVDVTLRAA